MQDFTALFDAWLHMQASSRGLAMISTCCFAPAQTAPDPADHCRPMLNPWLVALADGQIAAKGGNQLANLARVSGVGDSISPPAHAGFFH